MIKLKREALEKRQAENNWNDTVLAEKIGVNRTQVWRVKEGRNEPGREFIAGVLRAFPDASFDEFFHVPGALREHTA